MAGTPAAPRGVCARRPGLRGVPPWTARACVRVRVWRAAAEGGREAAAGPAPGRRARGGSSASWDRRAPAAAAARWRDSRPAPRPPALQPTRLPVRPDAAAPGLSVSAPRRERK